ncbi:sensor histidine kinase [Paenibacillus sp. V4I5]|uniref:sensor histidine kinase n=1 Tax=Paenibacillus sp. V4I5 TaxID=3042306 RepID=UPI002792EF27|nr:sensor histidine kinase [Paenibacillus sp. V4I5]MDQ0916183.1 two-component system sensor histidine kinase YesM [Paenibacillus sp. V4I5]
MKTYHAFFLKNLFTFLIPMLVPILILGTMSTVIIKRYVTEEINHNTTNMLKQTKENIELIFKQLDSLNIHFMANAIEFANLKSLMLKPSLELDDYKVLATIKNLIDAPAMAMPYIDSVYVYLNNDKNRLLSTTSGGLIDLNEFYDKAWFDSYKRHQHGDDLVWTENRTIKKYNFENSAVELISLYRKLSRDQGDGLIVLNIDAKYIENHLSNLSTLQDQTLLILGPNGDVMFKNKKLPYFDHLVFKDLVSDGRPFYETNLNGQPFIVSKLNSDKYGWTYLSIAPKTSLYEVPDGLNLTSQLLLLFSFLFGSGLTYYLTRKNYRDVKTIVTILESAENSKPLPALPSRVKDVYSYIIHSILKNFIEQNYLSIQLSERKYKAQAMELIALQSQLNPHFLYNTLETINWKIASLTGKPGNLNKMVENLADILRYSLEGHNKPVILQKEIAYTLSYIDIQKVRYHDKFDVVWEYEEHVNKYNVPKLILQPLIENSIYHGIKVKEGSYRIKIKIWQIEEMLHLAVIDNGIGIGKERLDQITNELKQDISETDHIGLYNTHKRLKLLYGESFGIKIRSKYGWGTAVYLTIPI